MEMKMIDTASGRALVNMTPQRARELISTIAANSQQYRPPMEPTKRIHELSTPSITNNIDELNNVVKNMLARKTNPAQFYGTYAKLDHPTDSYSILLEDTTAQVDVIGNFQEPPQRRYDLYLNMYNAGWRDHPNLIYGSNPQYNQKYQSRPPLPQQYQPPKSSLETIIEFLFVSTEKFQQKTKVHLQEMDHQISKLALTFRRLENPGKLPSQTELNQCPNASAVTVKDRKESKLVLSMSRDHDVEHEVEPAAPTGPVPHKPFVVPPLYPGRFAQVKKEQEEKEILKTFQKVEINIPYT
ncbi:uncharacterized protein [Gossypium hirsutum]|uniref:Uncharacterized protein n=1 Tax=Gossypium hirsutum TaxID=3635 RepID=A0A1U8NX99_GOSHI|nr:uncharacterized protein LOC107951903 [Gossypium hirsutum]